MVVLVSIKQDDGIGQGKAGIAIGKWGAITILKKQRPHLYQCPSPANQTFITNPLASAGYKEEPQSIQPLANSLTEAYLSMGSLLMFLSAF